MEDIIDFEDIVEAQKTQKEEQKKRFYKIIGEKKFNPIY